MWGPAYKQHLETENVNVSNVIITKNETSGIAQICVADNADNIITIVAGANNYLSKTDIINHKDVLARAELLITQLEISAETVIEALTVFKETGGVSMICYDQNSID